MKGFKLILAVSADGFLARGVDDNMDWTSQLDKTMFRLMTMDGSPLLAGRTTFEALPPLKHRELVMLSRKGMGGLTLEQAHRAYPGAWLIGGPMVAEEALKQKLVDRAFLFHQGSAVLTRGIHYAPLKILLPAAPTLVSVHGDLTVRGYLGLDREP